MTHLRARFCFGVVAGVVVADICVLCGQLRVFLRMGPSGLFAVCRTCLPAHLPVSPNANE